MNKQKVGIIVGVLLLLVVGTIWAMRGRADAQFNKVRELRNDAFAGGGHPDPEKMKRFTEERDKLSPEQRDQLRDERESPRERQEGEDAAKFFSLPQAQRNEFLDERIRDEEKLQKDRQARRAQRAAQQPNQPRPGSNANAGGPPRGRRNLSSDEKMQQRNRRLDKRTPEQRAQRTAFREAMDKRRKELGLPPPQRPLFRA